MRRTVALFTAVLLLACGGGREYADDAAAADAAAEISLAEVAGTWDVMAMPETGDAAEIPIQIMATDMVTGWMIDLPNRDPMELRVIAVDGDSIVTENGPYESILREGVLVSLRSVMRLEDGMLKGTFVATYQTEPVETMAGTLLGTPMP